MHAYIFLQVSSAALEVLRAAVRSCPRALLDAAGLERLMPAVFLRTADARDATRELATGTLAGAASRGGGGGGGGGPAGGGGGQHTADARDATQELATVTLAGTGS